MEKLLSLGSSNITSAVQSTQQRTEVSCNRIVASWQDTKEKFFEINPETQGMTTVDMGIRSLLLSDGIQTSNIIAIPWYYMEESHRIIQVLEQIKGDSVAVIYFNGVPGVDHEEFNIRYNDLRRLVEKDGMSNKILLIKHAYSNRISLGGIRADMIGGIIKATSNTLNDPILYGFDADTYDLSSDHIVNSEKIFKENENTDFIRSQLRWNNGIEDGYAWFSEIMMHLLNSIQNKKHIVSMGGATAFRLRSYIRVGGYLRDLDMGEDIMLGKNMKEYNPEGSRKFGGKIYVDPRRGIQSVHEGKRFQDQWNGMKEYSFIDKGKIFTNEMITELNHIIIELINGKEIPEIDRIHFSNHINGRYFVGKMRNQLQKIFMRFWNINMSKSYYRAVLNEHSKVIFVSK